MESTCRRLHDERFQEFRQEEVAQVIGSKVHLVTILRQLAGCHVSTFYHNKIGIS